jgi:hypothetical protein
MGSGEKGELKTFFATENNEPIEKKSLKSL